MGFLAPLIISVVMLGFAALFAQESRVAAIDTAQAQEESSGQAFLAYRNAVMTYQQNNPTFTGVVPTAAITAYGGPLSSAFLAQVSNVVVSTGVRNGRVVICYGPFSLSVAEQAALASSNDASFGVSNGTTWTSAAVGAPTAALPLITNIPSGNVVSVIQMDI